MDAKALLKDLAVVIGPVEVGVRHLAEQAARIEKLERGGHDTQETRALLMLLEDTQRLHVEHRDRLMSELQNIDRI